MALIVGQMRRHGMLRRGKSLVSTLLIVVGDFCTIACGVLANLLTVESAIWLVVLFAASGAPMVVESLLSDHQHEIAKELKHE
jgi:hypothetical protein